MRLLQLVTHAIQHPSHRSSKALRPISTSSAGAADLCWTPKAASQSQPGAKDAERQDWLLPGHCQHLVCHHKLDPCPTLWFLLVALRRGLASQCAASADLCQPRKQLSCIAPVTHVPVAVVSKEDYEQDPGTWSFSRSHMEHGRKARSFRVSTGAPACLNALLGIDHAVQ